MTLREEVARAWESYGWVPAWLFILFGLYAAFQNAERRAVERQKCAAAIRALGTDAKGTQP